MNNQVDYFEIGTPDPQAAAEFYGGLFGWKIGKPSEQGYSPVNQTAGGIWDTTKMGHLTWGIFYVHVEDVKKTIEEAQKLGARIIIPFTTGGGIDFGHLADPQGNRFGVWRPSVS